MKLTTYVIKSRTGKMHFFDTLEEAMQEAKNRSTKSRTFVVYCNGKSVAAFTNKKELPKWELVSSCDNRDSIDPFQNYNAFYLYRTTGKVKLTHFYGEYVKTNKGTMVHKIRHESITINKNRIYFWRNKLYFAPYDTVCNSWEPNKTVIHSFVDELLVLKPELRVIENIMKTQNIDQILCTYKNPTIYCEINTYKEFATKRPFNWLWYLKHKHPELITEYVMDNQEVMDNAMKDVVHTKQFRIKYIADPSYIDAVRFLQACGFNDPNCIYKSMDVIKTSIDIDDFRDSQNKYCAFIKTIIRIKGEVWTSKMLEICTPTDLIDAARMASNIKSADIVDFICRECGNLSSIHDSFAYYLRNLHNDSQYINKTIKYNNEEHMLARRYNDITFELAKDTKELAVVGADMGICVGSYADYAINKYCVIVIMRNKNKNVACIELRNNCVEQIKAKFNNPVPLQYKDVIDKWIQETGLFINTEDYDQIGEPWNCNHNYAVVNPDLIHEAHAPMIRIIKCAQRLSPKARAEAAQKIEAEIQQAYKSYYKKCNDELYAWCEQIAEQYN